MTSTNAKVGAFREEVDYQKPRPGFADRVQSGARDPNSEMADNTQRWTCRDGLEGGSRTQQPHRQDRADTPHITVSGIISHKDGSLV